MVASSVASAKDRIVSKKPQKPSSPESGGQPRPRRRKRTWLATHGRDLKFLGIFLGLICGYFIFTRTQIMKDDFFPWYLRLNARVSANVLNLLGHDDVSVNDQALGSAEFRMYIARGCDGVDPSALFIAAVLASPVALRRKLPAVFLGTIVLMGLNVVRIVTLYFTGLYFKRFFDLMHLDVWQAVFIILALALWAIWAYWIARQRHVHVHG